MKRGQNYEPLVSVIIPVYNTAPYLKKCLRSIIEQTYNNLEILCVDDGSTDGSNLILDEFAVDDPRIKVISTPNRGVAAARNTGLAISTGEYIGFVDSDDYIHKSMYETLVKLMLNNDVDIVSCGYYFDRNGNIERSLNLGTPPKIPMDIKDFIYYMYKRDEYKGVAGYLWTRLFRRELIKNQNGVLLVRFPEDLDLAEDIVFLAKVCKNTHQVMYTDKALYYYVQRESSAVHDYSRQLKNMAWIYAYERIIDIYRELNVSENIIDIIIRMYVFRCGKLLEIAIDYHDKDKENILVKKIKENLVKYVETNMEHLERVYWILGLLCKIN